MSDLEWTRGQVAKRLEQIQQFFVTGSRITVIVRMPGKPEQDFMLTDDEIDDAIAVLQRSKDRPSS